MFGKSVPSLVTDAADLVVGAGEVEPGTDVAATTRIKQWDGV